MKYFLRFHGASGMHAGYLPGYPASHGCVRLPLEKGNRVLQCRQDRHAPARAWRHPDLPSPSSQNPRQTHAQRHATQAVESLQVSRLLGNAGGARKKRRPLRGPPFQTTPTKTCVCRASSAASRRAGRHRDLRRHRHRPPPPPPPPPPPNPRPPPPPAGRSSRGRASFTVNARPSTVLPLNSLTAFVASSSEDIVTKAKPRDLPVNLSWISMTSCTVPAPAKRS